MVDLFNEGLQGLGLPMSDEPFKGTAWIGKHLEGPSFVRPRCGSRYSSGRGFEIGANVPFLQPEAGSHSRGQFGPRMPW